MILLAATSMVYGIWYCCCLCATMLPKSRSSTQQTACFQIQKKTSSVVLFSLPAATTVTLLKNTQRSSKFNEIVASDNLNELDSWIRET